MKRIINALKTLRLKNFVMLLMAGCINAFGVTVFLAPVKLYDSGISGTSMLLSQVTPEYMTLSVFLMILNIPLFLFGLRKQGAALTVYSLFVVAVYSLGSWLITDILPLYSIVTYMAALRTVDFIVEGFDRFKEVMIVTDKPEKINEALWKEFECGTTKIAATGGYSNAEKTIIYVVVNRFQISKIRNIVHSIDPGAFVTISEVADVFKAND